MSSWKARLLIMLTMLAMLVSVLAAPAMADHLDDNDCDDDGVIEEFLCEDDNGDDEDVDVDRISPRCFLVTVEEDDEDELFVPGVGVLGDDDDEDVDVKLVCVPSLLHEGFVEDIV